MATTKVSELTELTSAADGDLFLVADVSTNQSKKITKANLGLSDENFTTALKNKLDGIEASATADQTGAEIKTAYEGEADTNAFTDAEKTKLSGIETGATADQSAAEIKTAYESNADTNAFTDADHTKLDGIETGADVTDTTNVVAALTAGTNITIAGDGTISATDTDTGILNVVEDTTPQLGGDLDANGNNVNFGDNDNAQFGASNDLQIYHNGTHSYLKNATGDIVMQSDGTDKGIVIRADDGSGGATSYIIANGSTGAVDLYNYGNKKLATTSTGIDITGTVTADGITNDGNISTDTARSPDVVDNDGSFDLNAGTNFTCTPTGNITLTFTNIPDGQSGTVVLINTGGHTISAHSNTKVMGADMLTTITTAGTYVIGYISDGTNVRVYNSLAQQ